LSSFSLGRSSLGQLLMPSAGLLSGTVRSRKSRTKLCHFKLKRSPFHLWLI
jgi:hypothetical protein